MQLICIFELLLRSTVAWRLSLSTIIKMDNWLRVDTHVHVHNCYDEGAFLDAAALNVRAEPTADSVRAALCLTEVHGVNRFEAWANYRHTERIGCSGWSIAATDEAESILAKDAQGRAMAIIAGRQIECEEGIEVLAIGHAADIADGQPVREVCRLVSEAGAIPVLPWGFLKWSGKRGVVVDDLLRDRPVHMLVGDNGARLAMTSEPRQFLKAREKGIPIMPGTDPFPFAWDLKRVGSFGLQCAGSLSRETPYADFKRIVLHPSFSASSYGKRLGLLPFVRNQVAIQLRKRLRRVFG
jgi:hypothetical protein